MFSFNKKSLFLVGIIMVFAVVFLFGIYMGYNNRPEVDKITALLNKETPPSLISEKLDFGSFWKTWNAIESKYMSSKGLDKQEMIWGATAGLVRSLEDPHSVFFPPKDAEIFESSVRGDFEGVGMEIGSKDNILTVVAPLKGTPADRAGIMAGDKIIKIDTISTVDMLTEEAVRLIRGERGTKVVLTVLREMGDQKSETLDIEITRDKITIPVLVTEQKENGIFVIELYSFSARSGDAFREALQEMTESGSSKLIIDLRGNAGGYLEMAVDITSWFLPAGEIIATELFGDGKEQFYRSKGYNIFEDLSLVILVNQGSASASEIMAGALREHGKATLVGEKTYGKGSVQELIDIDKGSSLKLTIARWLTPNGNSISENGLEPDVEIELTIEDFKEDRDPQMDKAIEILSN